MSTFSATGTNSRRGLARWSVAAVATAALVVSGSGLVAFAQSGSGGSQGPVFVPADTVAYVEARLDLPGGQGDALSEMLTAFPGFADPGSFEMKVDEVLGGLSAEMGVAVPEGDLFGDVLTGEIGIALGDIEGAMMGGDPSLLIGLAVADAEAASAAMASLVADSAMPMTESTYNDVAIYTDTSSSPPMSIAMHNDWLVVGTGEEMVQRSIDVLDGTVPGLADEPGFVSAWGRLPDPRLGAVYLDFVPLTGLVDMASMVAEGETGMSVGTEEIMALLPQDMVASLVAEDDRLNLEVLVTPGVPGAESRIHESDLALSFPADTQVYLEMRDVGSGLQTILEEGVALLEAQDMGAMDDTMGIGELDMLLSEDSPITALLGVPLPEFLDFVGDTGVGAGLSSDGLWLGIAGEVIDPETAQERVTSLLTILRMFLLSGEDPGIAIDSADVAGVEVTTITLPLDQLAAESGLPLTIGNDIDVALTNDMLLVGLGDYVENAILADQADSLGASEGYIDALAGDVANAGVTYVNVSSLLAALDPMLAMMAPEWEMIAPYAAGVDRMIVVPTADEEVARARLSVIVGQ